MLNRVIEKQQIKCHQYFPLGQENDGEDEMTFEDVGLKVIYISVKESNYNYTVRMLHIQDLETFERKEVVHFHYTTWPDFHVPDSPCAFLDFLFAVRTSGALEPDVGPPVIHCSAGIGRSGTFCLVDTCLVLIEQSGNPHQVSVRSVLMDMRQYRMGLIQTYDQLRFSYLAIIEGTKRILGISSGDSGIGSHETYGNGDDIDDDEDDDEDSWPADPAPVAPAVPPRLDRAMPHLGDTEEDPNLTWKRNNSDIPTNGEPTILPGDPTKETMHNIKRSSNCIRRRNPEERRKQTEDQIARMKERQRANRLFQRQKRDRLGPLTVGLSVAAILGSYAFYRYFWS